MDAFILHGTRKNEMSDMPQQFAMFQKVKNEAARKRLNIRAAFFWCTGKKESLVVSRMALAMDDAGFNEEDFARPVRVNFPVVDDLPEEGVFDTAFCDRYQLGEDGKTFMLIPGAAPLAHPGEKVIAGTDTTIVNGVDTATGEIVDEQALNDANSASSMNTDLKIDEGDDEDTRYPIVQMKFRKQLLSQLTSDALRYHLTQAEYHEIARLEMDTDNGYVQNLLLAASSVEKIQKLDIPFLWKYTKAVRDVFDMEKRHELSLVLKFTQIWAGTSHLDRGLLVKEWMKGNRVSEINRTPSGANAGGGIKSDRLTPLTETGRRYEIALGLLARKKEFDIYNPPLEIDVEANAIMNLSHSDRELVDEFIVTCKIFEDMPGGMDYSRACNVATVKTTPENYWKDPVRHLEYLNRVMTETDHAHPDELLVDIACGRSSLPMPMAVKPEQSTTENTSNEGEKPEVETTNNVQVQTSDSDEKQAGDALPTGEGVLQPGEGAGVDGVETSLTDNAAIMAAAAPSLANQEQAEVNQKEENAHQNDDSVYQNDQNVHQGAPVAESVSPVEVALEGEFIPSADGKYQFEPGRYEGLPNSVYHRSNGISSTMLKDARISLMYYHGRHISKTITRMDSEAFAMGRLTHTMVLEPEKFAEEFTIFPGTPPGAFTDTESLKTFIREYNADKPKAEQLKLTGKKSDFQAAILAVKPDAIFADIWEEEWRRDNAGKDIVTNEQLSLVSSINQALQADADASWLLNHPERKSEVSYFGFEEDTGLEIRVRPDIEIRLPAYLDSICADLKTISMGYVPQDRLKARLHREIIERGYHISAAMYCDVAKLNTFAWIFVNKDPGYHWVAVVYASAEMLELGRKEYRRLLHLINEATFSGKWPAPIVGKYVDELNDYDIDRLDALSEMKLEDLA